MHLFQLLYKNTTTHTTHVLTDTDYLHRIRRAGMRSIEALPEINVFHDGIVLIMINVNRSWCDSLHVFGAVSRALSGRRPHSTRWRRKRIRPSHPPYIGVPGLEVQTGRGKGGSVSQVCHFLGTCSHSQTIMMPKSRLCTHYKRPQHHRHHHASSQVQVFG